MKYCNFCNGSGEGTYDGSVCSACKGIGISRHIPHEADDDDWRVDARIEARLAEEEEQLKENDDDFTI